MILRNVFSDRRSVSVRRHRTVFKFTPAIQTLEERKLLSNTPYAGDFSANTLHDQTMIGEVYASNADNNNNAVVYSVTNNVSNGTLTLESNGGFTYVPKPHFAGQDSFTWQASEVGADPATATTTINVTNQAPVASDGSADTLHDQPLTNMVYASDGDSDQLNYSVVSQTTNGTLSLEDNGLYTYTPNSHFTGQDSFTWKANDGVEDSNTVTTTINVNDQAPEAYGQSLTTPLDAPVSSELYANDADGDPLTYSVVSQPSSGTLVFDESGAFTYTPTLDFTGQDSFTFTSNDGIQNGNTETVTINVNPVSFSLASVSYSGAGQISLMKDGTSSFSSSSMTFASSGSTSIANPVWQSDGNGGVRLNDPVAYVRNSVPHVTIAVQDIGTLAANTVVTLVGSGTGGQTTTASTSAGGGVNETLIFDVDFTNPVFNGVANTQFAFNWKLAVAGGQSKDVGTSSTQAFMTYGTPSGTGMSAGSAVSAKRLDQLTKWGASAALQTSNGQWTPYNIVTAVGPKLIAGSGFDLKTPYPGGPWIALDGAKTDCRTLATLTNEGLGLLGIGSSVMFVYARTGTWVGLSSASDSMHQTTVVNGVTYDLDFNNGGHNNWEGCCVWSGLDQNSKPVQKWFAGGGSQAYSDDYAVWEAFIQGHQEWYDKYSDTVSGSTVPAPVYPSNALGRTYTVVVQELSNAGYSNIVINYIAPTPTTLGKVLAISPSGVAGQSFSPYSKIVMNVADYPPS